MFGTAGASPDLLSEGVPFFGRLGEVAYDPDEDRVQCHLCGEWLRQISSSHLHRTHGCTSAQYRDAFQLPLRGPLCAPSVSSAHRLSAQARIGRNRFGLGGPSRRGTRQERVRPWQSLAARSPQLVEELHPAANPGLDPAKVAWAANRRVSWRCSTCGHEWVAVISSRTAGSGCPQCARRKGAAAASATKRQVARSRSLAVLRPDLLDLWDPSLNGDIDPLTIAARSSQHVWWRCPACAPRLAGKRQQSSSRNPPPLPHVRPAARRGGHGQDGCGQCQLRSHDKYPGPRQGERPIDRTALRSACCRTGRRPHARKVSPRRRLISAGRNPVVRPARTRRCSSRKQIGTTGLTLVSTRYQRRR